MQIIPKHTFSFYISPQPSFPILNREHPPIRNSNPERKFPLCAISTPSQRTFCTRPPCAIKSYKSSAITHRRGTWPIRNTTDAKPVRSVGTRPGLTGPVRHLQTLGMDNYPAPSDPSRIKHTGTAIPGQCLRSLWHLHRRGTGTADVPGTSLPKSPQRLRVMNNLFLKHNSKRQYKFK